MYLTCLWMLPEPGLWGPLSLTWTAGWKQQRWRGWWTGGRLGGWPAARWGQSGQRGSAGWCLLSSPCIDRFKKNFQKLLKVETHTNRHHQHIPTDTHAFTDIRTDWPVHGVVIHKGSVALQVEFAECENPQSDEGDSENQTQQGVRCTTTLCNTGDGEGGQSMWEEEKSEGEACRQLCWAENKRIISSGLFGVLVG